MTTAATNPWTRSSPFLPHCQPRYVHLNNPENVMQTNPSAAPSPHPAALPILHQLITTLFHAAPPALHSQIHQILRYLGKSA
ncbi:MAG: hypothetical protein FJW31_04450 [Acidobacteria bacterium]|nr:hypothetical protein [Acidobacteriota bacterium]